MYHCRAHAANISQCMHGSLVLYMYNTKLHIGTTQTLFVLTAWFPMAARIVSGEHRAHNCTSLGHSYGFRSHHRARFRTSGGAGCSRRVAEIGRTLCVTCEESRP